MLMRERLVSFGGTAESRKVTVDKKRTLNAVPQVSSNLNPGVLLFHPPLPTDPGAVS